MHPGGQQVASCYQPPRPYASQRELMPLSVGCGTARPQPPPPPPSLPHSHNLNASNAMQIMSFRFSIKMLNHYFTLHSGPSRSDQTRFNKQQGRRGLRDLTDGQTHIRTCHYGFDLLFVVLRYQFIYYFCWLCLEELQSSPTGKK